ncbi:acyltransferase [Chloroflexota bacterium]
MAGGRQVGFWLGLPGRVLIFFWVEIKLWLLFMIANMPGQTGERARRRFAAKAFGIKGGQPRIGPGLKVVEPDGLTTGDRLWLGQRVILWADGGIVVGDDVMLGPDVKIYSSRHSYENPDVRIADQGGIRKEVVIEDDVWLEAGVVVFLGVRIGRGAVISAGSIVSRSVPPHAIVAGNPARIVG